MKIGAKNLLRQMRGTSKICGCGKELEKTPPFIYQGKKHWGVQHKTTEDEEHHNKFFSTLMIF